MTKAMAGRLAVCALLSVGCGGGDGGSSGSGGTGAAGADSDPDGGAADGDAGIADGAVGDADAGYQGPICGDGIKEGLEQCDDGNYDDLDGCNSLCDLSCEADDDCDDLNPCNGTEKCTENNACIPGEPLAEADSCGPEMSCWNGLCLSYACGDGAVQGTEECDDGNLDPADGCTPDCEFTCLSTDSSRDCSQMDQCMGAAACDDKTHVCGGTPLADETDCQMVGKGETGWCMKGVCVPADCGDGSQAGAEQCDQGEDNGKAGSGCSIDCKKTECGNGEIEPGEECDDGNDAVLDGCDGRCKAEITHRLTRMDVLKDLPPEFCEYNANRFGEAFPGPVDLSFLNMGVVDVMGFVNDFLNASIDNGEINVIYQILDSNDSSFKTSDDQIWLVTYRGQPAEDWQEGPPLDYAFLIADNVDENNQPLRKIEATQRGGGPVLTSKPVDVAAQTPIGDLTLFDMRLQTVYDVSSASTPASPPRMSDSVAIPETAGVDLSGKQPYRPAGRMCGATSAESLGQIAWNQQAVQCCPDQGGAYIVCEEGDVPGVDCSSFLDLVQGGCSFCVAGCTPGCGFPLISGIEPDIDMDGDGVNDAFSVLLAIESRRVRVNGVAAQ